MRLLSTLATLGLLSVQAPLFANLTLVDALGGLFVSVHHASQYCADTSIATVLTMCSCMRCICTQIDSFPLASLLGLPCCAQTPKGRS